MGKGRWRGRGSFYRSFRSPTLNELYREFRQAAVLHLAFAGLGADEYAIAEEAAGQLDSADPGFRALASRGPEMACVEEMERNGPVEELVFVGCTSPRPVASGESSRLGWPCIHEWPPIASHVPRRPSPATLAKV